MEWLDVADGWWVLRRSMRIGGCHRHAGGLLARFASSRLACDLTENLTYSHEYFILTRPQERPGITTSS